MTVLWESTHAKWDTFTVVNNRVVLLASFDAPNFACFFYRSQRLRKHALRPNSAGRGQAG